MNDLASAPPKRMEVDVGKKKLSQKKGERGWRKAKRVRTKAQRLVGKLAKEMKNGVQAKRWEK